MVLLVAGSVIAELQERGIKFVSTRNSRRNQPTIASPALERKADVNSDLLKGLLGDVYEHDHVACHCGPLRSKVGPVQPNSARACARTSWTVLTSWRLSVWARMELLSYIKAARGALASCSCTCLARPAVVDTTGDAPPTLGRACNGGSTGAPSRVRPAETHAVRESVGAHARGDLCGAAYSGHTTTTAVVKLCWVAQVACVERVQKLLRFVTRGFSDPLLRPMEHVA